MILLDTHVLLWARADPERLTPVAHEIVAQASGWAISDITLWEIAMLHRKGRIELSLCLVAYLREVASEAQVLPISLEIATAVGTLPDDFPARDPADRIIYTTAQVHELPLVSSDRELRGHDPAVSGIDATVPLAVDRCDEPPRLRLPATPRAHASAVGDGAPHQSVRGVERDWPPDRAAQLISRSIAAVPRGGWPWLALEPPVGTVTVFDVLMSDSPDVARPVGTWAEDLWAAYADRHATVRGWLDAVLQVGG